MKAMKLISIVGIAALVLSMVGCSGSSEPSADDQNTAKANFTKSMSKEEAQASGVGGAAQAPVEGKGPR